MNATPPEPPTVRRPAIFLSSFSRNEVEERELGAIACLRKALWELGGAEERIWVAEHDLQDRPLLGKLREPGEDIAQDRSLEVLDVLIDRMLASEQIVIVLGGKRRGLQEHGALVNVKGRMSAVSHFEIELFRAAMCGQMKPVHVFKLDGFSPGPRLAKLIEMLEPALPSLRSKKTHSAADIRKAVGELLRRPLPKGAAMNGTCWLVNLFNNGHELTARPLLFMGGIVEPRRDGPDVQMVRDLIVEQQGTPNIERRLTRLWIAVREMMCVEQASAQLPREFLLLWNQVITQWNGSASWGGLFGHIFGGVFSCLNSLTRIREELRRGRRNDLPEDDWKAPLGAYASAYYSFAKRAGWRRPFFLRRALGFAEETIADQQDREPGIYAVRGSVHMHMLQPWRAASDFRKVLELRERMGEPAEKMGEALVDYGFAKAACGSFLEGETLMRQGIRTMDTAHQGFRVRAMRKLGNFYRLTQRHHEARELLSAAAEISRVTNMHDQTRQLGVGGAF